MTIKFCLSQNIPGIYFHEGGGYILDCYTSNTVYVRLHRKALVLKRLAPAPYPQREILDPVGKGEESGI